ncbi:hypothetical protein [Sphingobacterium spiritivorum]|uniref:hypothetical protein n=1 Tax=Sphingobacterium spiritivorum TaxID=258 RepID=UPI0019186E9A|nr:hypothetical protein [Sphingobacterium spiritivorum]QQT24641.1 hypothetical protein I6J02_12875 [Sphingobacterium spiritivorum]
MTDKLEIEISNGVKDLDILKDRGLSEIKDLMLIFFKPISLKFLKNFTHLERLTLSGSIKDFSPVSECLTLRELQISGGSLENLDFIKSLSIKSLTIDTFKSKTKDFTVPNIKSLEKLVISEVPCIVDLTFLSEFESLKSLMLFHLKSKNLFNFSKLTNLKDVSLVSMNYLSGLSELKDAKGLEQLRITNQRFGASKPKINVKSELLKILSDLVNLKSVTLDDQTSSNFVMTYSGEEIGKVLNN